MPRRTRIEPGETRTISYGERPDGRLYVIQVSEGEVTQFAFGADRHECSLTFDPRPDYGLTDLTASIEHLGEDELFLSDVAVTLDFWDIPYAVNW